MFNKITKENPNYAAITAQLAADTDRFDYNALARELNSLAVGELVSFAYPKGKAATLSKQLEKRGLKRDSDFSVKQREVEGSGWTAFVTRLSETAANILAPAPRGPRKKAEGEASTPKAAKTKKA